MKLEREIYKDKVYGCWLGKGIGGTLGMPYEGYPWPLSLSSADLSGTPVPNDDLELQLVWMLLVEKYGSKLRAEHFAQAWIWEEFHGYNPDEYGVARWNIRRGLKPPITGLHNNWFTDGMGGAIRSEIWACLFPDQPELAAAFAREDAMVDHNGNGVWAEIFLAAAESAAFSCEKPIEAINEGLVYIPCDCKVARAIKFVKKLYEDEIPLENTRRLIMDNFGSHNFTDVSMNLAFIACGLIYGEGDFEKSLLTAVNCGMDTDCTGATTAAFMGVLLGNTGIPGSWRETIGNELIVSDSLSCLSLPETLEEAVTRTVKLYDKMNKELNGCLPKNMTLDVEVDNVDDGNQWLVFVTEGGFDAPEELLEAEKNPAVAQEYLLRSPGILLNLSQFVAKPSETIFLLTWLAVPYDLEGQLMICSDTGITAWLDGQQILNYHGRRKALPTFHRTEGGASIPVSLEKDQKYLLKIRLFGYASPLGLSVAVGDLSGNYVDVEYSI